MNQKKLVEKNIKQLKKLYNLDIPLLEKVEILEIILDNLEFLKETLSKEEFKKNFSTLEQKIKKVVEEITDPKLIKDLISKIQNLKVDK